MDDRLFDLFDLGIWGVIELVDILVSEVGHPLSVDILELSTAF